MDNDAHDSNITVAKGILCKMCYDILITTSECKCKNIAIIIDDDTHMNLYVDDIHTAQQAILYLHNGKEIHRELLSPFAEAIYVNYAPIKHTPLNFKPYAAKNDYKRKTKTKYNTRLIDALTRFKHKTSDGNETFLRTSLKDPKKDAK